MTAKGAALSGMSRAWAASGALLTVENLGMATIVYAVAFVAFWLGWYAPTTPMGAPHDSADYQPVINRFNNDAPRRSRRSPSLTPASIDFFAGRSGRCARPGASGSPPPPT